MADLDAGKMNRKELVRAYRETPRPMGVWCVRNLRDGRALVGRSVDVNAALNRERAQLRLRSHRNRLLQADWISLGEEAFAFEVLDTLTPPDDAPHYDAADDLRVLEALWLDRLLPYGERGYNAMPKTRDA